MYSCASRPKAAGRIVSPARFFIVQHAIRFIERLHIFLGPAAIGMPLVGRAFIKALDIPARSIIAGAENLVIIGCWFQVKGIVELPWPMIN